MLGLTGNVECFFRGHLHAGSQFVGGDPRGQIVVGWMLGKVAFVEPPEQRKLPFLWHSGKMGGRIEVEDSRLARPDQGALVDRRQPSVGEVRFLKRGQAGGMAQHHVGR